MALLAYIGTADRIGPTTTSTANTQTATSLQSILSRRCRRTYARFKSRELTPWLYEVPSQVLRNGAVRWKTAYSRFFQMLGGRPTIQRKSGPQSVWLTNELFSFEVVDGATPVAWRDVPKAHRADARRPTG